MRTAECGIHGPHLKIQTLLNLAVCQFTLVSLLSMLVAHVAPHTDSPTQAVTRAIPFSAFSNACVALLHLPLWSPCLQCCALLSVSPCDSHQSPHILEAITGPCRCLIRPAPRCSMILLAELLSVPNTHCPTSSPKSIIMLFAPSKIDAPLIPA